MKAKMSVADAEPIRSATSVLAGALSQRARICRNRWVTASRLPSSSEVAVSAASSRSSPDSRVSVSSGAALSAGASALTMYAAIASGVG
jgi:hypothetical protein